MRFLVMLSRWNDIFFFCVHLRSWRFDHRKLQIFCFVLRTFIAESLQLSWETILLSFVKLFDLCEFPADLTVATTPCFEYRLIFQKLIIDINNLSPVQRINVITTLSNARLAIVMSFIVSSPIQCVNDSATVHRCLFHRVHSTQWHCRLSPFVPLLSISFCMNSRIPLPSFLSLAPLEHYSYDKSWSSSTRYYSWYTTECYSLTSYSATHDDTSVHFWSRSCHSLRSSNHLVLKESARNYVSHTCVSRYKWHTPVSKLAPL